MISRLGDNNYLPLFLSMKFTFVQPGENEKPYMKGLIVLFHAGAAKRHKCSAKILSKICPFEMHDCI